MASLFQWRQGDRKSTTSGDANRGEKDHGAPSYDSRIPATGHLCPRRDP